MLIALTVPWGIRFISTGPDRIFIFLALHFSISPERSSVLKEDGIYKMWYTTAHQGTGKGFAYAQSRDGLRWDKPEMGIVRVDGRETNLVIAPLTFGHMYQPYGVLKDPRDPDPKRRYKLAFLSIQRGVTEHESPTHPGTRRGLGIAFSPDGLRWSLAEHFAAALPPGAEGLNQRAIVADSLERYLTRHPEFDRPAPGC